jgi:uncharacterized membrane protein HdeD (DUF308 family)
MSDGLFHARLRASSDRLFWLGLVMVVLGIAAIVFPMIFTLVAALLVGWILLISGVGTFIGAFSIHGTGPFFGALLLGLLSIAAGVFMIFNPLAGAAALTLVVGVIFVFQGAFEMRTRSIRRDGAPRPCGAQGAYCCTKMVPREGFGQDHTSTSLMITV